jgi:muramoyltetrapeptide carboxypeptidase
MTALATGSALVTLSYRRQPGDPPPSALGTGPAPSAEAATPPPAKAVPPAVKATRPDLLWPRALPARGVVGVVAPGRPVEPARLERGLKALRDRRLRPKLGAHLRASNRGYAGSAAERAGDINALLADESVQAIWCARGGKGCLDVLPLVHWERVRQRRLPLIGYSDVTLLQLAQFNKCRLVAYAGPMVAEEHGFGADGGIDDFTAQDVLRWLRLDPAPTRIEPPPGHRWLVVEPGTAEGTLLGGNLSRVVQALGTSWLPDLAGAVLLLEEVHESAASERAMLRQLADAGVFRRVSGVVLGEFSNRAQTEELHRTVRQCLAGRAIPVLSRAPYGHRLPRSTWPHGARVRLRTSPPGVTLVGGPTKKE